MKTLILWMAIIVSNLIISYKLKFEIKDVTNTENGKITNVEITNEIEINIRDLNKNKYNIALLGGRGFVGQEIIKIIDNHKYFDLISSDYWSKLSDIHCPPCYLLVQCLYHF